jgi:hypothetical protein
LLISEEGVAPSVAIVSAGADSGDRAVFKGTRCDGTLSSPTVPSINDYVLSLLGAIYDGTDPEGTASVDFLVDGAVSANVAPQRISFATSATNGAGRTDRLTIKSDGKIGIGTITVPHASVGAALLAIEGANSSVDGPHLQLTTASDDYPLLQIIPWSHDSISICFDSYYDGSNWKSSDAGSSFRIGKIADAMLLTYDVEPAGDNIVWQTGFSMSNTGAVSIPGTVSTGVITQSGTTLANTYHPKTTVGIADNNLIEIDDADAADNDYAKFTANGLEGRSYAEVLSDLSGTATSAFDLNGQDLTNGGVLFLTEQAAGESNVAGKGQFWIKTVTPNEAYFQDDAGTDWRLGVHFVDRGDPSSADVDLTTLTADGTWYDLDLSGTVPANAKAVTLYVTWRTDTVGAVLILRKNGNSNSSCISAVRTIVSGGRMYADFIVPVDSNRVIEYLMTSGVTFNGANELTVKGWFV